MRHPPAPLKPVMRVTDLVIQLASLAVDDDDTNPQYVGVYDIDNDPGDDHEIPVIGVRESNGQVILDFSLKQDMPIRPSIEVFQLQQEIAKLTKRLQELEKKSGLSAGVKKSKKKGK